MESFLKLFVFAIVVVSSVSSNTVGNRKVYFHGEGANFFGAFEICRRNGQQLLTARIDEDNQQIQALLRDKGLRATWLGATDLANLRRWVWHSSGIPVSSSFWYRNRPEKGGETRGYRCLEIYGVAFNTDSFESWNDQDCNIKSPFYCEDVNK